MELIQENVSALATKVGTTPEVITKFLTDAQAAAEVKPFADSLGLLEVFNPEQLTQRITNERTQAATEATNTTKGNTFGTMDKRILDDTGIAKNAGELTIDYMARAAKEKYGTKANESEELTRLRGEIAAKDSLLTQKDTELQQLQVQHGTERKQGQINASLDAAIHALPIQATAELLDSQREFVKYRLGQAYDIDVVDGKVVFKDKGTENVVRDSKTAAPMTAAALIEQFAPKVVSLKATSVTTGSGFQSSSTNLNDGEASAFDYTQYASKEEFAKALNKAGISSGSKRGTDLYSAFEKARPDLK
jgi:hypothetical protein